MEHIARLTSVGLVFSRRLTPAVGYFLCTINEEIPRSQWQPLSVQEIKQHFAQAPFAWGLAGGYAIEQFVGKSIREHSDIDIVLFRDNQIQVKHWLVDWQLFAEDPPGTLRP